MGRRRRSRVGPSKALLEEKFFRYVLNPIPGRCPVFRCTNPSQKDRTLCHRHHMQRWRAKHPGTAGYHRLKHHAKSRGLAFTVSLEEYLEVVRDYEHTKPVIKHGDHISVDRVDPRIGYVSGNLQAITVSENAAKQIRFRHSPEGQYWASLDDVQREGFRNGELDEGDLPVFEPEDDEVPF